VFRRVKGVLDAKAQIALGSYKPQKKNIKPSKAKLNLTIHVDLPKVAPCFGLVRVEGVFSRVNRGRTFRLASAKFPVWL